MSNDAVKTNGKKEASHEWAFLAATLLVSLGFGAYLSYRHVTDPFLYYDVGFVTSLSHSSQMVIPNSGPFASLTFVPGRELLMSLLSNMLGIDPQVLQFLPIGSVLISL